MYPPAQGMFLAAGEVLFHEPWVGVLLSVGLMFAAICWMMQQWMPPAWAFYGTLIAIARIGLFGPWIDSYLGGPVSALGGALVIGSIPRLRETGSRKRFTLFLFGLGVVILMNSRPFEGAVLLTWSFPVYPAGSYPTHTLRRIGCEPSRLGAGSRSGGLWIHVYGLLFVEGYRQSVANAVCGESEIHTDGRRTWHSCPSTR